MCFQKPQQLHKDRGEDGCEETSLSPFLSIPLSIRVSMETRREGGTGGGVAMGTDSVRVSVRVTLFDQGLRCACCLLKLSVLLRPLSGDCLSQTGGETEGEGGGKGRKETYCLLQTKINQFDPTGCVAFISL